VPWIVKLPPAPNVPPIDRLPEVSVPVVKEMNPKLDPTLFPMRSSSAFVRESVVDDPDPCEVAFPSMFTKHVVVLSEGQLVALAATGMRRDKTPANMASLLPTLGSQQNFIDKSLLIAHFRLGDRIRNPSNGVFSGNGVIGAAAETCGRRETLFNRGIGTAGS